MTNILLFSDLHIHAHKGFESRIDDCLNVLEWAFCVAEEHSCKDIFFLGDFFHDRNKIDVYVYSKAFMKMSNLLSKNDFDLYLLVGNHDMYYHHSRNINSVSSFSAFNNVHVISEPSSITLDDVKIDFMPFTDNPVHELYQFSHNGNYGDILLGHLCIHGAKVNKYYSMDYVVELDDKRCVKVDSELFSKWKHVFLGHYHLSQVIDNIEYVGSPLQLNFGEAYDQKHIIILDLDTMEKKYVVNDFSPKHIVLHESQVYDEEEDKFNNNFVIITVDDDLSKPEVVDMKEYIESEFHPLSLNIVPSNKKGKMIIDEVEESVQESLSCLKNFDEIVETYLESVSNNENFNMNIDSLREIYYHELKSKVVET